MNGGFMKANQRRVRSGWAFHGPGDFSGMILHFSFARRRRGNPYSFRKKFRRRANFHALFCERIGIRQPHRAQPQFEPAGRGGRKVHRSRSDGLIRPGVRGFDECDPSPAERQRGKVTRFFHHPKTGLRRLACPRIHFHSPVRSAPGRAPTQAGRSIHFAAARPRRPRDRFSPSAGPRTIQKTFHRTGTFGKEQNALVSASSRWT